MSDPTPADPETARGPVTDAKPPRLTARDLALAHLNSAQECWGINGAVLEHVEAAIDYLSDGGAMTLILESLCPPTHIVVPKAAHDTLICALIREAEKHGLPARVAIAFAQYEDALDGDGFADAGAALDEEGAR